MSMQTLKIINFSNVLLSETSTFHYCFIDDSLRKNIDDFDGNIEDH